MQIQTHVLLSHIDQRLDLILNQPHNFHLGANYKVLHGSYAICRAIYVDPNTENGTTFKAAFRQNFQAYIFCDTSFTGCILAVNDDKGPKNNSYAVYKCVSGSDEIEDFITKCKDDGSTEVRTEIKSDCIQLKTLSVGVGIFGTIKFQKGGNLF